MTEAANRLAEQAREILGDKVNECLVDRGEVTLIVPRVRLIEACTQLRDAGGLGFEELIDVCGIDYADYGVDEWDTGSAADTGFSRGVSRESATHGGTAHPHRFAAVYHLLSISNNQRIRVRCYAENDDFPVVDSVIGVWRSADWFEREAFDMYGIVFEGHPDLRRLLTDYGFIGHPFRKDFPVSGHVEMRYDAVKKRTVYEPVTIEPRVTQPRIIREDKRYQQPGADDA
ncbi:MAG: NADH-quinone oxidoreductase subunit C [Gammaproteobacteria bacterium]|nr:MAG: NADH-quinone oxidoreductase subunit C [Gammaproteobacteria bacterium]